MRGPNQTCCVLLTATALALAAGAVYASAPTALAATVCDNLTASVYDTVNPRTSAQLLTVWNGESKNSVTKHGFTTDQGVLGLAAPVRRSDTVPIYRMYNASTVDFVWALEDEIPTFERSGYEATDTINFYAAATEQSCTVAVHRLTNGTHTRYATSDGAPALSAAGWSDKGVIFHLATIGEQPAPTPSQSAAPTTAPAKPTTSSSPTTDNGTTFAIGVIPDTQAETNVVANTPFLNRVEWMVKNKDSLGLAYVLHTGDVTNWGWLDVAQFARAKAAMKVLADANLPYSVAIGNHDTAVVGWNGVTGSEGYGGGAYMYNPECLIRLGASACKSWLLLRNTDEFNRQFTVSSIASVGGVFEQGKIDNNWTTFTRGDSKWLVLTLELDPREAVVDWAEDVVKTHPQHNVIIQTHHYLSSNGSISTSNDGYGAKTGQYIFDRIVSQYSNVKLVFSGHVGGFTHRTDTNDGNTVVSFLGNDLGGPTNNPVRVVKIDTQSGTVDSTVYNPIKAQVVDTTSDRISVIRG